MSIPVPQKVYDYVTMKDDPLRSDMLHTNSADTLLSEGSHTLHDKVSTIVEASLGRAMPQVEIRFKDLSINAKVVVTTKNPNVNELPTIWNHAKKSIFGAFAKKRIVDKEILKNVSGVFKPGTITLVLGQPSSGKSSLMKILSGRFPMDKNIQLRGDITYNGEARNSVISKLPQFVAYVNQRDQHYPTLTVKETLAFAHQWSGGKVPQRVIDSLQHGTPEENENASQTLHALYAAYPTIITRQLGLEVCEDTIVGNAMLRGISGGERKRVTTGEMEFGMKFVTLMDEISTGLDSAATFDIIKTQRSIAKTYKKTVVISLLQPSPEVFDLFDEVMILNEGHVMYHGPRELALAYFENLGFKCPPQRDVADFLLDLGTEQQYQYQEKLEGANIPRLPSSYAAIFQNSPIFENMMKHVEGPHDPLLLQDNEKHIEPMLTFNQSFWDSTESLMRRQMMVSLRNKAFIKGRAMMVILMGLIYGSTFYQVDPASSQVVMGIIFQSVLFLALGQASQIPTFMEYRNVFYKQRGANFYRTSSYVLSNSVAQVPFALVESIIFGSVVYWMSGFVSNVGSYFIYELLLFATNMAFAAWFFFISAASHDLHVAKPISMLSILFFVLFAGFVISRDNMPDYFIWIYWINPIAWCVRSLAINQYMNSEFERCMYGGIDYCKKFGVKSMGEYQLQSYGVQTEKAWVWYGIFFMFASYVLFMYMAYFTLEYKRYESPENTSIVATEVSELSASQVTNSSNENNDDIPYVNGPETPTSTVVQISKEEAKNFTPVSLAFENLWYSVPKPGKEKGSIDLLKGISGFALPGTITALMGSSGAGKTTLMDVIAGRKTGGKIQGSILLNGHPATDLAIRRCTGYCEQMDIHSESATFREALTFSAFLRQSSDVSDVLKLASVQECLDLLEMNSIADKIIRGSSVEQMKRLTIGVELAAQPSVLFLDEPTSGLDARSAKIIMSGIRKIANTGRTVVCTIHQPSTEVFIMFDSLLLLKRGGETVFFGQLGEKCQNLITYFTTLPNTQALVPGYNPATWMLEVIGAGVGHAANSAVDYVDAFNRSKECATMQHTLNQDGINRPHVNIPPMTFDAKRASTSATQCKFLCQRFMRMYWRTPSYNWTRLLLYVVLAILFGLVYVKAEYSTFSGANAGVGMIFLTTLFVGVISFNSVLPLSGEERDSFYRERSSQTYNALWYFVGGTLAEIPYVFVSTFLFTIVYYPFVGFIGVGDCLFYGLNLSLFVLMQVYFGQMMAYAMPRVEVAAIMGVLLNSIFFLFMGFNPPTYAIPSGYRWLYHITPPKYSLAILTAEVFSKCVNGNELGCRVMEKVPPQIVHAIHNNPNATVTIKEFVEFVYEMKHDDKWTNFASVIGFIALFRIVALLSLRYINHQKR